MKWNTIDTILKESRLNIKLQEPFKKDMFQSLNKEYDGVIFYDNDEKFFCLIKKPGRNKQNILTEGQLINMLETAKEGKNYPNLEAQFDYLYRKVSE